MTLCHIMEFRPTHFWPNSKVYRLVFVVPWSVINMKSSFEIEMVYYTVYTCKANIIVTKFMNIMLIYVRYHIDSKIINIVIIDQITLAPITCIFITPIERRYPHKMRLLSVIRYIYCYTTSMSKWKKVYGLFDYTETHFGYDSYHMKIRTQKRIRAWSMRHGLRQDRNWVSEFWRTRPQPSE